MDTQNGTNVAVKVARKASLSTAGLAAFSKEARILSALQHTNIERLHSAYEDEERYYLVVELVRPLCDGEIGLCGS